MSKSSKQTKIIILIIIIAYILMQMWAYSSWCNNSSMLYTMTHYNFSNSNDLIASCVRVLYKALDSSFIIVNIGSYCLYFVLFKMVYFDLPLSMYDVLRRCFKVC